MEILLIVFQIHLRNYKLSIAEKAGSRKIAEAILTVLNSALVWVAQQPQKIVMASR